MMYNYVLIEKNGQQDMLTFLKEDDAIAWARSTPQYDWEITKTRHITHINAQTHLDWNDVPKHLSFIYRDSLGVWACQYRPRRSKWYGQNNDTYRRYGGERLKLEYKPYHELIKLGDVFENSSNNKHFINWNKVKGAHFIKFIDEKDQIVEVFDKEGKLVVCGSNTEIGIISKMQSMQFHVFPWQTYTFVKE